MGKRVYELRALGRCFRGESVARVQEQLEYLRKDEGWTFDQLRDNLRTYLLHQQAKRRFHLVRELQRYHSRRAVLTGDPQHTMDELVADLQRVGFIADAKKPDEYQAPGQ